jgi:hypothetical protein
MEWQTITADSPPDGSLVETKIDDANGSRNEAALRRRGRLWFFADASMYVYYEPTHWRPPSESKIAEIKTRLLREARLQMDHAEAWQP